MGCILERYGWRWSLECGSLVRETHCDVLLSDKISQSTRVLESLEASLHLSKPVNVNFFQN
jgi:hypothetical protein